MTTPDRDVLSDQEARGIFTRDPCDGCDGTCGDVCPVLEAQRHALERRSRSELRRDAVMDPVGLAHEHAAVVAERDRLQAENAELRGYLDRYGRHERKCSIHYAEDYGCSCGWGGIESALASDETGAAQ